MVIWKYNKKCAKKARQAKVVDTLRLQASNPDRLEAAKNTAKEFEYEYQTISLVKVWDDWFAFGLDMDERSEHEAILVNSKSETRLAKLYHSRDMHFTDWEIDLWREELLRELLKIESESNSVDMKQVANELVGMTNERVAGYLSEGSSDIKENAKDYASIVTS